MLFAGGQQLGVSGRRDQRGKIVALMSLALLPLLLLVAQYQTSVNGRLLTPKDAPALATLDRISEQGKTHRVQAACRPGWSWLCVAHAMALWFCRDQRGGAEPGIDPGVCERRGGGAASALASLPRRRHRPAPGEPSSQAQPLMERLLVKAVHSFDSNVM